MPVITGKTVVVTGGSRGIGFGLVQHLLARDNTVIATARKTPEAAGLQQLRSKYPAGRLQLLDLDTSQPDSVAQWAAGVKGCTSHVDVSARPSAT
jgi:NAD(P)-dependent dehydrogenase (short-subunit alcohol dehydrogenase family)